MDHCGAYFLNISMEKLEVGNNDPGDKYIYCLFCEPGYRKNDSSVFDNVNIYSCDEIPNCDYTVP